MNPSEARSLRKFRRLSGHWQVFFFSANAVPRSQDQRFDAVYFSGSFSATAPDSTKRLQSSEVACKFEVLPDPPAALEAGSFRV